MLKEDVVMDIMTSRMYHNGRSVALDIIMIALRRGGHHSYLMDVYQYIGSGKSPEGFYK